MWHITDKLFLGEACDSQSLDPLKAAGITHILNCTAELPCSHPTEFQYLQLHLKDPDSRLAAAIPNACRFLEGATHTGAALIHCQGAISRSPSVLLAYLCHQGKSLQQAVAQVSAILPTKPNRIFLEAIGEYFRSGVSSEELASLEKQLMGIVRR